MILSLKPLSQDTFNDVMDRAMEEAMALPYLDLQERCIELNRRYGKEARKVNTVNDAIWLGYAAVWTERYHTEILAAINT